MAYKWYGDINPQHGGMFLDLEEFEKWKDFCPCIKITDLDSAIGFDGAIMIEFGSIYIPEDKKKRESALSCCGYSEDDVKDNPVLLVESFDAYAGVERDIYNGLLTIQILKDGAMEFDGWKADKRIALKDLKGWIESYYNVKF
jgi:hypothetical protein